MQDATRVRIPSPQLQISFSHALSEIRGLYLQEALSKTIEAMIISDIDAELSSLVPQGSLSGLARHGLRGELVFAVPCVLRSNPRLLGYYRLLLGFSKKAFYASDFGTLRFKPMEEKGILTQPIEEHVQDLCSSLTHCACDLIAGIGVDRVSRTLLDDLTLLTLGPQLRGGANVEIGALGIVRVFKAIHSIVARAILQSTPSCIEIRNAAGRRVFIEFAPDPDIIIREEMAPESYRNIIAIEVKAGTDFSNIHNRLGEAEKSHAKARNQGYVECWTVVNVDRMDIDMAKQESPSTNRFFRLSDLESGNGEEFHDFCNRVIALTGIPNR